MQQSSSLLRDFTAQLLEAEGAVIERIEPHGLEFMAPENLQRTLGVSEFGRLGFAAELPTQAQRVSFESDWLARFNQVIGERGRILQRALYLPRPTISDPERVLEHTLKLQNAVYRLLAVQPAWTRYLIMIFHYSALSEEKRDGITHLAINLSNGSVIDDFVAPMLAAVMESEKERAKPFPVGVTLPKMWTAAQINTVAQRALPERVRQSLAPFLESMQRRLERDLARLLDYHNDLRRESLLRIKKQKGEAKRETLRLEAIAREYRAKVTDVEQKYAMKIEVEWIQTLELVLPVSRFDLIIKRRKGERRFHLDWNPMARKLEPPPCEYSYTQELARLVCDESLHIVSPAAHSPCAQCGKEYCRACYAKKCPKCGVANRN